MNPFRKLGELVGWVLGEDLQHPREPEKKAPAAKPPAQRRAGGDGFDRQVSAPVSLGSSFEPRPEPKRPAPAASVGDFNASFDDLKDLVDEPLEPKPEFIPEGGMSTESLMREFESLDAELQSKAIEQAALERDESEAQPASSGQMSTQDLMSEVAALMPDGGEPAPVEPAPVIAPSDAVPLPADAAPLEPPPVASPVIAAPDAAQAVASPATAPSDSVPVEPPPVASAPAPSDAAPLEPLPAVAPPALAPSDAAPLEPLPAVASPALAPSDAAPLDPPAAIASPALARSDAAPLDPPAAIASPATAPSDAAPLEPPRAVASPDIAHSDVAPAAAPLEPTSSPAPSGASPAPAPAPRQSIAPAWLLPTTTAQPRTQAPVSTGFDASLDDLPVPTDDGEPKE